MIDRRDFLKSSSAALAGLAINDKLPALQTSPAAQQAGRLVLSMNRGWRFSPQRADKDTALNFDDSSFEQVTIPHSNKKLPWHSFDEKSYQFVSIYRRHFRLPAHTHGRHVFVDFDGAMTASTVWINGKKLGEYKGGYTPFSFELTPQVNWDEENVLAVELDSSERADIPPFGGAIDYLTFGGIYRDVWLRIVPATYLENIFARPKDVLSDRPGVDVACFVAHLERQSARLTLEAELRDGDQILATARKTLPLAPASPDPVLHELAFNNFG